MAFSAVWLNRLLRRVRTKAATDPLLEFQSEVERAAEVIAAPRPRRMPRVLAAAAVLLLVASGFGAWRSGLFAARLSGTNAGGAGSVLSVTTQPAGLQVVIDGVSRGATPLTLNIVAGSHTLSVRSGSQERTMTINATPGAEIVRDIEFSSAPALATVGSISVVSDPPGAQVVVDGQAYGASPIAVSSLAAGTHTVVVSNAHGSAERTIDLRGGQNTAVMFSLLKTAQAGWLQVMAPFDLQLMERGEVIGTSGTTRIMLPAGRHDVEVVNQALEYYESRRVVVTGGKTATLRVDAPEVAININARPWADVIVDGRSLGQTPISNARVLVGTRKLIFRHPELGEREETVFVTTNPRQRFAVDLTK
jgi:hypothetical protein